MHVQFQLRIFSANFLLAGVKRDLTFTLCVTVA